MPVKTKAEHRARFARDLRSLQETLFETWLSSSVPEDWHGIAAEFEPNQKEVTLELDEDMVGWFRRQGCNAERIMNLILRVYWRGLMAGILRPHWEPEVYGPNRDRFFDTLLDRQIDLWSAEGATPEELTLLRATQAEARRVLLKGDPLRRAGHPVVLPGEEPGQASD